jgi:aminopeptidase N
MTGKLARLVGALVVYFAIGTTISLILGLVWLRSTGALESEKLTRIAAIARGVDLAAIREEVDAQREKINATQVSIEDVARARALKAFDLELREQALRDNVARVKSEQDNLAGKKSRYETVEKEFQVKLDSMRSGAIAANAENARLILESIKPKQAKEQIVLMIKDGQMKDVVALLTPMPVTKRAKIITEFKTPEEAKMVAELLDLIREGVPEAPLVDEAKKRLNQPPPAAP